MWISIGLLAAFICHSVAETVTYNWDITWVNAAPDGFSRPIIGINGQWPCPPIKATVGDQVVVTINNKLGNETTSLHFHGIHQRGTNEMDGAGQVTQCPVPPGYSFTYSFTVDKPGTYWYHSHTGGQYPDGLRGPLIVYDPDDPYAGQYDEEFVLTTSDWYHDQGPVLLNQLLSPSNVQNLPPFPVSGLLNDTSNETANVTLKFTQGKTYKIRVINMAALAATMLQFDSHTMKVIEIDGVYVHEHDADQIRVSPAQRYAFLLEAKPTDGENYAFLTSFDINRDFTQPGSVWALNVTGYIEYDPTKNLPVPFVVNGWDPLDDFVLAPYDNQKLLPPPDNQITLDFRFGFDDLGIPRAYMNNTYVSQKVPTLYSVLTVGEDAGNPVVYGQVNPLVVQYGQTVEIVLNNLDAAIHPFHLHGHQFQVCDRPASGAGLFGGDTRAFPSVPMRRDTVSVNGNSHVILRFTADNPGVWLFHCHIEWHVSMGLVATVIEAPAELQRAITIPQQHLDACIAQCLPTAGNAAGNTVNHTDLAGANTASPNPDNGALVNIYVCSNSTSIATSSSVSSPEYSHPAVSQNYRASTASIATESPGGGFSTASGSVSTVYSTTVYTISSCAPTVTNCPYGQTTTESISQYTTICPETKTSPVVTGTGSMYPVQPIGTPLPTFTGSPGTESPGGGFSTASGSVSTVYSTTVYTISSCAPTVTNCPYGQTTTETISQYTTICPETKTSPVVTGTGSMYPVQPSGTPLPTFTGSAGKAAANVIAVVIAAVVAVIVFVRAANERTLLGDGPGAWNDGVSYFQSI